LLRVGEERTRLLLDPCEEGKVDEVGVAGQPTLAAGRRRREERLEVAENNEKEWGLV
jgi:hypothetical protein